jgi:hypothetical protein
MRGVFATRVSAGEFGVHLVGKFAACRRPVRNEIFHGTGECPTSLFQFLTGSGEDILGEVLDGRLQLHGPGLGVVTRVRVPRTGLLGFD